MRNKEEEHDFFSKIQLIDRELSLHFIGKINVSAPDTRIFAYCFSMNNVKTGEEMGQINIKAGYTENIINFRGNIGYSVYEKYRGNHYACRSCMLLIPVIKFLELNPIYLTCNEHNIASMRSIELLGAKFIEKIEINESSPYFSYYPEDSKIKLRYKWEVSKIEDNS